MGVSDNLKPYLNENYSADRQASGLTLGQVVAAGNFSVDKARNTFNRDAIPLASSDRTNRKEARTSEGKVRKCLSALSQSSEFSQLAEPVEEWFGIFHLWDAIRADATEGKAAWRTTNTKYPLSSSELYKCWENPDELIGVRFANGHNGYTKYGMVDLDTQSQYHPLHNPSLFRKLLATLEAIGLCRHILLRSSDSEGLHIYFPLPTLVSCYKLALAMRQALEQAEFEVRGGQLEIFPNVKLYGSLYTAHRLPLQTGSWVLNEDFQPVHRSIERLVSSWREVASQQDIELLEQSIAAAKLNKRTKQAVLYEWRERLKETIETGWTARGQTNRILMEACIYARVFVAKDWDEVEPWVLKQVLRMPGYQDFCNHRKRIKTRIREWVKANRAHNRYYPCKTQIKPPKPRLAPPNDIRSKEALQRIKDAIASIVAQDGKLPDTVRARERLICQTANCSAQTLRKYLELWHPAHQPQGCVTADAERVSDIPLVFLNDLETDNKLSNTYSGCVTALSTSISSFSEEFLNNCLSAESPIQSAVTGDRQLSVYSSFRHELKSTKQDKSSKDQDQNKEQVSELHSTSNSLNLRATGISVHSVVKRKIDNALFQVKHINSNGTFWAKWLKQYVPLVDVLLKEEEVELVSSK